MPYQSQEPICAQQACWLPMERIVPRRGQGLQAEDCPALGALCESIRQDGLLSPITVRRRADGGYAIVSGNRRYMACRMLGMTHMDAFVLPGTAEDESLRSTLEALAARGMHYLDEARAAERILSSGMMDRSALARRMGVTAGTLTEKLRLLTLDEGLKLLLLEEGLPEGVARLLLRLPDSRARMRIALEAAREKLTLREVEARVSEAQARLPAPPIPGGRTITLMRDHRLYLNAVRAVVAQMQEAGLAATIQERTLPGAVEVTLRLPTRRKRASRR